jgi:hypothetical protein
MRHGKPLLILIAAPFSSRLSRHSLELFSPFRIAARHCATGSTSLPYAQ